jgi:hypothetical protein
MRNKFELVRAVITDMLYDNLLRDLSRCIGGKVSHETYFNMDGHLLEPIKTQLYSYGENQVQYLDGVFKESDE